MTSYIYIQHKADGGVRFKLEGYEASEIDEATKLEFIAQLQGLPPSSDYLATHKPKTQADRMSWLREERGWE